MATIKRQLNHQKTKICVVNLLPILATAGSRVLEKKVNEHRYKKLCLATLRQGDVLQVKMKFRLK